ncbi:MAG: hypothetical protein K2X81_21525, partial [Candidatus Obscuribacterales bacterium]|nr:hypothetical protein [Candidatus Obscuribacterales bacterium]
MKRQAFLLGLSVSIWACGLGSSSADARPRGGDPEKYFNAPQSLEGKTVVIPIGTVIEGRMNSTISSKDSNQGE